MTIPSIYPNHNMNVEYHIERARAEDIESLLQLESVCWPKGLRLRKKDIEQRLVNYPEGQWVLRYRGRVVGVLYTQRIESIQQLAKHSFETMLSLHVAKGRILQFLSLNIHPDFQERHWGGELLQYVATQAEQSRKFKKIAAVTRCKSYKPQSKIKLF